MKEIINISLGQAGIQISKSLIQIYLAEHKLTHQGQKLQDTTLDPSLEDELADQRKHEQLSSIFEETQNSQYRFRSLLIDTEPDCINELLKSSYASALNPHYLLQGKESANTYAKGYSYNHAGFYLKQAYQNTLQKLTENCDSLEAFVLNHSLEGGTGSGLAINLLEEIQDLFPKILKTNFILAYERHTINTQIALYYTGFERPAINTMIAPYNTGFALAKLKDLSDNIIVSSNDSLYEIAAKGLDISFPELQNLNWLIGQINSSYTVFNRFNNSQVNCDMQDFGTNLVLYPKINFILPSLTPIITHESEYKRGEQLSEFHLVTNCYNKQFRFAYEHRYRTSQKLFYNYYERQRQIKNYYLTGVILARGQIDSDRLTRAARKYKTNSKDWVNYLPNPIKIGLTPHKSTNCHQNDLNTYMKRSMTGYHITSQMFNAFKLYRIYFNRLYSRKAFVHWFTKEGMEKSEFQEAMAALPLMEKEYLEIARGQQHQESVAVTTNNVPN